MTNQGSSTWKMSIKTGDGIGISIQNKLVKK